MEPNSTVSFVPNSVICRVVLLVGQLAADHICPLASAKNPADNPDGTVSTNNDVLPSRNSMRHPDEHGG